MSDTGARQEFIAAVTARNDVIVGYLVECDAVLRHTCQCGKDTCRDGKGSDFKNPEHGFTSWNNMRPSLGRLAGPATTTVSLLPAGQN